MTQTRLMQAFPSDADHQVTLANWRLPPFSRWAFHHVREVLPTANIAGGGAGAAFRRSERKIAQVAFQGEDGKEWNIGRLLSETFTDGFILLQRGRVLSEWYDAGQTPQSPHIVFSVSKSISGTLAGIEYLVKSIDPDIEVIAV